MASKSQLAGYISLIEDIRERHPELSAELTDLIASMQNDYNDTMYRELERQRLRRAEEYATWLDTEIGKKVEELGAQQFIVIPSESKTDYRLAKKAVAYKYPGRSFTMRYTSGVGTLLTRIK